MIRLGVCNRDIDQKPGSILTQLLILYFHDLGRIITFVFINGQNRLKRFKMVAILYI